MTKIIVPLYGFFNRSIKRVLNLAKVAKYLRLSFSNFDEVGGGLIAIDTTKKKLLYLKNAPGTSSCLIVDLSNLKECTVKKQYDSINPGELNKKKLSDFLRSMFLSLRFKNDPAPFSLSLYEAQKDKQHEVEQLEAKAKKWETIFSKLLPTLVLERA